MLTLIEANGACLWLRVEDRRLFLGVPSALQFIKSLIGEEADRYGEPALAAMHKLEAVACRQVCLDWLAMQSGQAGAMVIPSWPNAQGHQDQQRWRNVLHGGLLGFMEFCERHAVDPIAINAERVSPAYALAGRVDLHCLLTWGGVRLRAVVSLQFAQQLLGTHRLAVRCYSRLDGIDAQLGVIFHGNRETGTWDAEAVDLSLGLVDVNAVAYAARLHCWAHDRRGAL